MAKALNFTLKSAQYAASPVKVDRKKLYGWTETLALDDEGRECTSVTMDETGTVMIPKGGIGMGILSPSSRWVDRASLVAVTAGGQKAELVPSSFDSPIALDKTVSAEEFLDYTITAMYQLETDAADLAAVLGDAIYSFVYNYRADYEGSAAFLIAQGGEVFMLLGYNPGFEFVGLEEAEAVAEDAADEDEESGDIDFAMF
jgi:hypothetical protein